MPTDWHMKQREPGVTRPLFIQISFEAVRGWPRMTTFLILAGGCGCLTLVKEDEDGDYLLL